MKFLSETQTLNRSAPFYSVCQREGIKKKWGKFLGKGVGIQFPIK